MKIKLLTGRVGMGWQQAAGQVVDVPKPEADRMIAARQAVPAETAIPKTFHQITQPATGQGKV